MLLVHGFNSAPTTWNSTTQSLLASNQSRTCIALFDYGADSTQWVTDQAISHSLAISINTLAAQSAAGGGPGKVIIVAHSRGGLADRCASDPTCSAAGGVTVPGVAAHIAELITFGTPTLGSQLKADGVAGPEQVLGDSLSTACYATNSALGALPGLCSEVRALFTSAAGAAFTPGSPQQIALNKVTMAFPVFTIAGDVGAQTSLFGHLVRNVGSLGDLVVGTASATAAQHTVAGLGGQAIESCGELDLSGLPGATSLPTAALAAAYAAAFSAVMCLHTDETNANAFLGPTLGQITKAENTLALGQPNAVPPAQTGPHWVTVDSVFPSGSTSSRGGPLQVEVLSIVLQEIYKGGPRALEASIRIRSGAPDPATYPDVQAGSQRISGGNVVFGVKGLTGPECDLGVAQGYCLIGSTEESDVSEGECIAAGPNSLSGNDWSFGGPDCSIPLTEQADVGRQTFQPSQITLLWHQYSSPHAYVSLS